VHIIVSTTIRYSYYLPVYEHDPPKGSTDWLVVLGKVVRSPLAVKPAKVDTANNATDYEYHVPPFSAVSLSVYHEGSNRWDLALVTSESPVEDLAPPGEVERLCEVGDAIRSTWFELHGGPLGGAFVTAGTPDNSGLIHTLIISREAMEAEKAREEAEGAPHADSVRERVCAGRAKNSE
jgi:hypothetical protein